MKRVELVSLLGSFFILVILVVLSFLVTCASPETAPAPATTPAATQAPATTPVPATTTAPATTPAPVTTPTSPATTAPATIPTSAPTPTATPAPTTTTTPTTPPAQVQRATVEIGQTGMHIGQSMEIPIMVKNINDAYGLGAYHFDISFNNSGIRVDKALGGDNPFNMVVANITQGNVDIASFQPQVPGPTGNITVARLTVTALSQGNWPLTIKVFPGELVNTNGDVITPDIVNGTIDVTQ